MNTKRILSLLLCFALLPALVILPAFAADKTLTLREDWRLTSDLDLNVPEGDMLIIEGNGHYVYELGGRLLNSGLGAVIFSDGTILYPEGNSGPCTTETSNALMARRQPHVIEIKDTVNGSVTVQGTGSSKAGAPTALPDERVGLVITPAEGYTLGTLTVQDESGKRVAVTNTAFKMPASGVTISATFQIPSSGHSSGPSAETYKNAVAEAEHGKVTSNPSAAAKDAKVTVTVSPDNGYETASVAVRDAAGREIAVTKNDDGTYTFTQPDGKVTITAVFQAKTDPGPEPKPQTRFVDVEDTDWFHDAVYHCTDKGYFNGVDDTHFSPNGTMTRAMFAAVLYRIAGEPEVLGENPFSDVEEGTWYADAVIWAAGKDIIEGYGDGTFGTNDAVTREQMVTLFWRYQGKPAEEGTGLSDFTDTDKISEWARESFAWAVTAGIITGKDNGILDPKGTSTRAEIAQIVMNYETKAG